MKETFINRNNLAYIFLFAFFIILGSCSKEEDMVLLNPDAGSDFNNIENDGYVVRLNAVPAPDGQLGTWRIYIGVNGRFDDVNDPKTNFHGEPGEKYVLGWELSEGEAYKAASINVSFKPLNPVILNPPTDTIFNNISLYLNAKEPRFGATGKWTIEAGKGGRIINPDNFEAEFVGEEFEKYTVRWTLSYGAKEASSEFKFVCDELRANAGNDNLDIITKKETAIKFYTLSGYLPAGASASWNILEGENGKVYSTDNENSLFEGKADSLYTLTWTVNIDGHVSTDTVNIRFRGKWGMWTDSRDGQSYRFTNVNNLEWMADNFNYAALPGTGSWYYGQAVRSVTKQGHPIETEEDRKKYGRLYNYNTAVSFAPDGWRLPTAQEMTELISALGGPLYALDKLVENGTTGIDFGHAGYFEQSSNADPAFRNIFTGQDQYGMYWLKDYSASSGYAAYFEVATGAAEPGMSFLPGAFFGLSVRYVRNVKKY